MTEIQGGDGDTESIAFVIPCSFVFCGMKFTPNLATLSVKSMMTCSQRMLPDYLLGDTAVTRKMVSSPSGAPELVRHALSRATTIRCDSHSSRFGCSLPKTPRSLVANLTITQVVWVRRKRLRQIDRSSRTPSTLDVVEGRRVGLSEGLRAQLLREAGYTRK